MKRLLFLALIPLAAFAAAPTNDWAPNVTLSSLWLSNVTNGEAVWDRQGALDFNLDALASSQFAGTEGDAFHVTAHVGADYLPRYLALDRGVLGGRADWQHTFGSNDRAPVFSLEAGGDYVMPVETERRGLVGEATAKLRKQFGTAWHAAAFGKVDRYHANNAVFDSHSTEAGVEIGRDLNDTTRLTLSGRWRNGDVVTYAQYHRPDLLAIAHHYAVLKTFHHRMTAYSAPADTSAAKLALVHATSNETAVILSFEYAQTKGTGLRFENQVIALSFVEQY